MRLAYLDCFSGIAGDMFLGALLDVGLSLKVLTRELARLRVKGYRLSSRRVMKGAVSSVKCRVQVVHQGHHHTSLDHILGIIRKSGLSSRVRRDATRVFERLAEAEGKIHGINPSKVEFHEVGAIDSIVDIVGTCIGLSELGIEALHVSRIPWGHGDIRMDHGVLPNPGPATLELLKGFSIYPMDVGREIVTPTGAALLSVLATPADPPPMTLERVGYGAGNFDLGNRPNVARLILGKSLVQGSSDLVWLVETNLDNATGETVGYVLEKLFQKGAVDVFVTPIQMKKSRPGVMLSVLVEPNRLSSVERTLLEETPTFGVRRSLVERTKLERREKRVTTPYGVIRFKVGTWNGKVVKAAPEYEDLKSAAETHGISLSRVSEVARKAVGGLTPSSWGFIL